MIARGTVVAAALAAGHVAVQPAARPLAGTLAAVMLDGWPEARATMAAATALIVSDDMELILPRAVTEDLKLKPGQQLQAVKYGGMIQLIPYMTLQEAYGFARGIDASLEREPDREL